MDFQVKVQHLGKRRASCVSISYECVFPADTNACFPIRAFWDGVEDRMIGCTKIFQEKGVVLHTTKKRLAFFLFFHTMQARYGRWAMKQHRLHRTEKR